MSTDVSKKKKRAWNLHQTTKLPAHWSKYKECEKKSKRVIKSAKHDLEKKIATDGNPKPFYAYLKSKTKSRTE